MQQGFKWQQERKISKIVKQKDDSFIFLGFCPSASMRDCSPAAPLPRYCHFVFACLVTLKIFPSKSILCVTF